MRPIEPPTLRRMLGRWRAGLIVAAAVLSVIACGGGGDSSGIGSGGSGSLKDPLAGGTPTPAPAPAPGPGPGPGPAPTPTPTPAPSPSPGIGVGAISGFGSIIVNGVAWDETRAAISGDDGGPGDRSMLLLGRQVWVTGQIDPQTGRGIATTVTLRRALAGQIERFDGSGRPVVLGLPVATDAGTSWGAPLYAASALRLGDRIEVHGTIAADDSLVRASRVESALARFSLREGVVSASRSDRCGFMLGTLVVDCSRAAVAPRTVANGSRVRVTAPRDPSAGTLAAERVDLIAAPMMIGGSRVSAEGRITSLVGTRAVVEDWTFDLAAATVVGGPASALAVGVEVAVAGIAKADGTVAATRVRLEIDDPVQGREFEATGAISAWVNRTSFAVRGIRIDARGAKIDGGNAGDLGNGVVVSVQGRLIDGVVRADEIEIRN